jgi:hypothetical protein
MAHDLQLNEKVPSKGELTNATQMAKLAFFSDPFFQFLSPNDRLRDRGLTIFFRANLAHLGAGNRTVTVRDRNGTIQGLAAWLPTGCYPQSAGTQLAQVPGTLRALPSTAISSRRQLVLGRCSQVPSERSALVPLPARRRAFHATKWRGHDAHGTRTRPRGPRRCGRLLRDAKRGQPRVLPSIWIRTV